MAQLRFIRSLRQVIKNKSDRSLLLGFMATALLLVVLTTISVRQADSLATLITDMYESPFFVATLAQDAYARVEMMDLYLRDSLLAENKKDFEEAVTLLEFETQEVYRLFNIMREKFSGDPELLVKAQKQFDLWGTFRADIIRLLGEGKQAEAINTFNLKGPEYIDRITYDMYFLVTTAKLEAHEFMERSKIEHRRAIIILWVSCAVLLALTVALAILVIGRVLRAKKRIRRNEKRFRGLFELSEVAIWSSDFSEVVSAINNIRAQGVIDFRSYLEENEPRVLALIGLIHVRHINEAGLMLFGAQSEQQLLEQMPKILEGIDIEVYIDELCAIWDGHHSFRSEVAFTGLDGWEITAIMSFQIPTSKSGFTDIPVSLADITSRKAAEEVLALSASVFTHADEGILITDPNGVIIDCNDAFTRITGYESIDAVGRTPKMLQSGHHGEGFYQAMWQSLNERGRWRGEIWNRRKNGEIYPEMLTISSVAGEGGVVKNYVAIFADITQIKKHEDDLKRMAHFDSLTGLPNRVLAADRLHMAMSLTQRSKKTLVVAYVDLDFFKKINDSYGHLVGDQLLVVVSKRMSEVLREGDTLARIGGDEFVAVLVDLDDWRDAGQVLNRLLDVVAAPILINGAEMVVSASIGITHYPQVGSAIVEPDQLYRQADQAMYQAKLSGRNCWRAFDSKNDSLVAGRELLIAQLKQAIKNNELVLYYQPKVNMRTGQVIGAEALLRWQHPERGFLPPDTFLPMVEENPISIAIGEWVLATVMNQMEAWHAIGLDTTISLNVGGYQFQKSDVVARLKEQFALHPSVRPEQLELEILETSAIHDLLQVRKTILTCKELGVKFALDDFGSGYSSLMYLRGLSVDVLKIDQSFVRGMLDNDQDQAILQGVISIAASLSIEPIAEGVETIAHGNMLLDLGCELAQGYAIARPMPAAELPEWVSNWKLNPLWSNDKTN